MASEEVTKLTRLKDVPWPNTRIRTSVTRYFLSRYRGASYEDLTIRDLLQIPPERMWNMGKKSETLLKEFLAGYAIFYPRQPLE